MYDIIGDIHGYADALEILLQKMGYQRTLGVYKHPKNRKVAFVGDFIDRGLKIRETLHIVKDMCDSGNAIATAIESLISATIGYVDNQSSICESDENYENVKNIYNSISTLEPLNTNNRAMISLEICNVKYSDVIYKMLSD